MQRHFVKFAGTLAAYPAHTLFAWYGALMLAGTLLLLLPACRAAGADPFTFTEALFTATSAASVTGLMVISTETQLSFTGQAVVLGLIQLGGLGVMSIGTLLFVSITGRQPVRFHVLTKETLGAPLGADISRLILMVIAVTLVMEAVGTVALFLARLGDGPMTEVLWWAVFHAVSGFCNAGISLQDASLAPWSGDPAVILTMAALIVAGGLGFPVLLDLLHLRREAQDRRSLRFHTQLVLVVSAVLVVGGALFLWGVERNGAFAGMSAGETALAALFQSVTARTAGFSTLPMEALAYPSLFALLLLMFVGGGACSTAGGIKVSTFGVLTLQGLALARHKWQAAAFGRRVPDRMIGAAMAVLSVYTLVLLAGLMLLLILESHNLAHSGGGGHFMDLMFEATSALGTVGLSTGITAELGEGSRIVLVLMMLLGRVGPLAMASMLLQRPQGPKIRYPESEVIVG
ncbi:TrkH family potassium uptake protein [Thioalkalivibrio sp. XN279]|uniref:TrkH family potassium uptake protein n=1 Tax=Thioalkalivibrio sp. XN279 TaxID=2714953 RepID=UPI001407D082|nr:potassium transporter TrkG [Thioalkalivibrio sp. XN279]NHA13476.1 Ktr system potassium transporter B [Thioalkalivibrio sp. XN279]